jgi:hypothetical protein
MTVDRPEPPDIAPERQMLDAWLDFQRATLALKCDGLTPGQLREPAVPPSNLTLLGLVRHMAEVEHNWFTMVLGGERGPFHYSSSDNPDGDFAVTDADPDEAFATWRAECADARRRAAAAPSLDVTGTTRRGEEVSLRWIMIHMIEEYARYNGHADLLRERIDGTVGV